MTSPGLRRPAAPVTRHLLGDWRVECVEAATGAPPSVTGRVLPATVPGQVHADLLAAGLIPPPDVGGGESAQDWVGRSRWRYSCEVEAEVEAAPRERTELVFDGLDTVAEVRLNGAVVGHARDQHLAYRWDVSDRWAPGPNRIDVTFDSALAVARDREVALGPLPTAYPDPYSQVRKMACNFGWDWGPRLITAGIWRAARLETWERARIVSVRATVSLPTDGEASARLDVPVDLALTQRGADDLSLTVRLLDATGICVAEGGASVRPAAVGVGEASVALVVSDPKLWWPVDLGSQHLYTVQTHLMVDGALLDSDVRVVGLRTVAVEEAPDEHGHRFALKVNGRRVRVRGYNWIPDLPFANEVTQSRLDQRLDQAVAGGANLLRVWGGGHLATQEFLDGCDRRGLMVWQDFPFACAAYGEDEDTVADVGREAEQAASSLASHPSLVLWCGGNECVWGWYDWGWREALAGRPWGSRLYSEVLPEVLARLDPARPYLPNTPWSGSLDVHPDDEGSGPVHIWTVWNHDDWPHYRDWDPSFVAEMGWCAPPAHATLRRAAAQGPLLPDNPAVRHHMRAEDGIRKLERGVAQHFGSPSDEDDWLYWSQLVQARAVSAGTEWLRSRDRCAGVVVWQLNDCWPALSWSAVDVDGLEKPLWFALRDAFAPRLLTVQPCSVGDGWGERGLQLVAVNDSQAEWSPVVVVRRLTLDGQERARQLLRLVAGSDATARACLDPHLARPDDTQAEMVVADAEARRCAWFFRPERELVYPPASYAATATRSGSDVVVTVTAHSLLRDVTVYPDRVAEALGRPAAQVRVDRMLVTLLPGETASFTLSGVPKEAAAGALDAFTRRPVLRVASDGRGQRQ